MSVIGSLFGCAFWKDDEQAGSYRFVGRIRTENARVLIEKFSTSILGNVKGTIPDAVRHHSVCTKRRLPTPFDINQLHLVAALSRQRSLVCELTD
jgi:hypothetical protein